MSENAVEKKKIKAPVAIFLSNREEIVVCDDTRFEATVVYFKPSVINDVFQYEQLYAGEFEKLQGTTLYQDYLIIRNFVQKEAGVIQYSRLTDVSLTKLLELIEKMKQDLDEQYDGYWPCRSRSFFIEILFFLNFCYNNDHSYTGNTSSFTTQVIEYLNQHIDERLDLDHNYFTKVFHKECGVSPSQY